MNVNLIFVGKYSLKNLNIECERYKKMLSKFCNVKETFIKETFLQNETEFLIQKKIEKDDENVLKNLKAKSYTILLDDEGQQYSSKQFSEKLSKIFLNNNEVNFIVGGSYGVGQKVKSNSSTILSLSKLTFSHEIARLILYEQIFRSFKILKGEKYDK